ncbi:ABC transporter permease [Bombiscardovia nodaiensis]|uniref:ABC transporter permease n=1 Tax=Bombiscardovia nodaiensis TaxID=2932181 RepID=A0ABN6S8K1_9BIFI|nr:ABC transporter permease [Bombiscardovia nodaiensis]
MSSPDQLQASQASSVSPVSQVSQVQREREDYRRKQSLKSVLTSLASTLVFAVLIVLGLKLSPGWPRVKESFFSGKYFTEAFPKVLEGLWLNVQVLFFAVIGVAILGTLLAVIRTSKSPFLFPLRVLAQLYTTVMRGIPMIVVLYLIGFGIPGLGIFGRIPAALLGTVAVILSYSAYIAEVLRAGFQDVHPSQRASARSLGLTSGQTMRLVVIPQALRKVAPALMNDFISMQKDVGLISVLGAVDAVRAAQIVVATSYNFTPYVVASVLFIATSVPFILLNDWYSARLRQREQSGGTV